jgi:type II secretory pathway pseudopilin PulG
MSIPSSLTRRCAADAPRGGFSLIEVILSIGILAIAIVSLLGLIGPTLGAVRNVLDQNAGVTAVSQMNTILDTTPFFNGTGISNGGSSATSSYSNATVYSWVKNSTNTSPVFFFFFDELDTSTGIVSPQVAASDGVSIPGNSTSAPFVLTFATLLEDAQGTNGTKILSGPVIAMSLSLSPMAQQVSKGGAFPTGENFYTAPADGIFPSNTLPANPNALVTGSGIGIAYPEAYLPILVQVFAMPVDQLVLGSSTGALSSTALAGVLTDSNRIFSYTTAKLR